MDLKIENVFIYSNNNCYSMVFVVSETPIM